jgi:hypothetical protein
VRSGAREGIDRRGAAPERRDVSTERLADRLRGDVVLRKCSERGDVSRFSRHALDEIAVGKTELGAIMDDAKGLRFRGHDPPIPELRGIEPVIKEGRRVANERRRDIERLRRRASVGVAFRCVVTARASALLVGREARVLEELLSERGERGRDRNARRRKGETADARVLGAFGKAIRRADPKARRFAGAANRQTDDAARARELGASFELGHRRRREGRGLDVGELLYRVGQIGRRIGDDLDGSFDRIDDSEDIGALTFVEAARRSARIEEGETELVSGIGTTLNDPRKDEVLGVTDLASGQGDRRLKLKAMLLHGRAISSRESQIDAGDGAGAFVRRATRTVKDVGRETRAGANEWLGRSESATKRRVFRA